MPACTLLPDDLRGNGAAARGRPKAAGVDGVVMTVHSPGYLQTDTLLSVEALVYSLARDKLLWASTSRTTDPGGIDNLVTEVADATAKEMTKQGLLAP